MPSTSFQVAPRFSVVWKKSLRNSHTVAPSSGPNSQPAPPIAVCMTISPEVANMNASGGMKPCSMPSRLPPKPAYIAATTKTVSL